MPLPLVAVVGRPNVGKSTFVNRIAQADEAIVHEMRGVTRDRSYHEADWNGVEFKLVDTGGIEMGDDDAFQGSIRAQAIAGANEADVVIFIVDGKTGINADDEAVARILRKAGKPVFLVVNKMDTPNRTDELWEFYQLGWAIPGRCPPRTATARETCSTPWWMSCAARRCPPTRRKSPPSTSPSSAVRTPASRRSRTR